MNSSDFKYITEQFGDIKILKYQVPGFDQLTLKQKKLLYCLAQAAYFGRDIIYDQNYKYNLLIRRTLEAVYIHYLGDRECDDFKKFVVFLKQVWFSNGIHHPYSTDKILPEFTEDYFIKLVYNIADIFLPLEHGQTKEDLLNLLVPKIFDPEIDKKRVSQDTSTDLIKSSANNLYENIGQEDVEVFYQNLSKKDDPCPVSYGLNSKLVKENGKVFEQTYKLKGLYHEAIEKIIFWLAKASEVAETEQQKLCFLKLIDYYTTGDLKTFDEFSILWVQDTTPEVDVINGFIEDYGDSLSYKATWESVVSFRDAETTRQLGIISKEAAWFEKHSPIMDEHKKSNPQGITYNVVNVVAESGDCSPTTPIGINLPNADWIRAKYGSKSVSLGNIEDAYNEVSKEDGSVDEFYTVEQAKLIREFGHIASKLHTGLHEVIGHGSGKLNDGVATPKETLKSYANTIEEARADLVALYFIVDPYLVEMGLIPSLEVGKAEYTGYMQKGLFTQLVRVKLGDNLEESHMRNRQLIAKWAFEHGRQENVVEQKIIDGKTHFIVNDYLKLRELFGKLLKEIQRIKSEGDYEASKNLVENYGVKIDSDIHKEALERYKKLNIAPFSGFINPVLEPVMKDDEIVDVMITYPDDFTQQMLYYAQNYSVLPDIN